MGVVSTSVCFLIMCILCGVTKQKNFKKMPSTVVWCVFFVFPCESVILLLSSPSVLRGVRAVKRFKEEQGGGGGGGCGEIQ